MKETPKNQILKLIQSRGRGWAFSGIDFAKKFKRWEIDQAFSALNSEGKIRRVITGIYDYPLYSNILKQEVAPDIRNVADAIARKYNWRIYPDGDTALNYLGLSTQVVAKNIYLSDGPSRQYKISNRILAFKHTTTKEIAVKSSNTALVIQAIKAMGEKQITGRFINALSDKFSAKEWGKIKNDATKATGWVYQIIADIADKLKGTQNG